MNSRIFSIYLKPWPNVFDISFDIIENCCMQHVERIWPPMLNGVQRSTILNDAERNLNMFKLFVQHAFNITIDLVEVEYVLCVWPSLTSKSFIIVEQCQ